MGKGLIWDDILGKKVIFNKTVFENVNDRLDYIDAFI